MTLIKTKLIDCVHYRNDAVSNKVVYNIRLVDTALGVCEKCNKRLKKIFNHKGGKPNGNVI